MFKPKRIALIGVSSNPNSVSGKVLTNIAGSGFKGVVYPINPDIEAVMAMPCFPDLNSLPKMPDLAIICSAAKAVPEWIRKCGEAGINGIIIMSSGFKEIEEEGRKKLLGVGRLISDPEHYTAEYAILVTDKWQNKDLGGIITDFCIDIARKWGIKKIYAQTTSDNHRMIALFKKRDFTVLERQEDSTVEVEKEL